MASADTWSDQTWNKPAVPYLHHLLAPLLFNGAIKLCPPPELPSAPAIIAAAAINIHVRKTGAPPGAYRQDLFWTTIPAKSSDRPGEPCFTFISFSAWILERISTAPGAESSNQHLQIIDRKHDLVLASDSAITEPREINSLPIKGTSKNPKSHRPQELISIAATCWSTTCRSHQALLRGTLKYLAFMASHSLFKHQNDFIESLVPCLAWLCWRPHSDCNDSPESAIGHA